MELIIAAGVTLLTQLFKWVAVKVGVEKAKKYALYMALCFSIGGTFGWKIYEGGVVWSDSQSLISIFGLAIGYYEIVIKRLINPVIEKLK